MLKQTAIAITVVMTAGAAGTAVAAQSPDTVKPTADIAFEQSFTALDNNGDGEVSWPEAKANGISHTAFYSAETTQDGAVSMAEYNAAIHARGGIMGEAVEIGEDTPAAAEPRPFRTMDANNDGRISQAEFDAYAMQPGLYARWDVNHDGQVDQQEFVKVLYVYFDDNGDGYVDDAEWQDGVMVDDYGDNGLWDF